MSTKENELYANTRLQPLAMHCFAVGYVAKQLFNSTVVNEAFENLSNVAFLAGCLHDIGKLDPEFQKWVKKQKQKDTTEDGQHIDSASFSFEKHPRHNEISLLLFNIFEQQSSELYPGQKEALQHVIYWHHAKPFRKNDDFNGSQKTYEYLLKNISAEQFTILLSNVTKIINSIQQIVTRYDLINISLEKFCSWNIEKHSGDIEDILRYNPNGNSYPAFKTYSETEANNFDKLKGKINKSAQHNLLRACVISADRLVSRLTAMELHDLIQEQRLDEVLLEKQETISNLILHIADGISKFPNSERSQKQSEVAQKLAKVPDIAVLAGAAGCGKTKIALEWAKLTNAQQTIWVCPRVQICQGIFQELIDTYLPDANVEILTGEFKFTNEWNTPTKEGNYFSGDVVVTTIDQILGAITTHTNVNSLLLFVNAHVVFDEYHEYIGMEIFNLLFAELIANKNMRCNNDKRTLLVSATPHYSYLANILDVDNRDVIEMPSFNNSQYQIQFIKYDEKELHNNPFYQSYANNTFVISNTAKTAQLSYLFQKEAENSLLFHSKYKRSDKKYLFNEVYESFKQDGVQKYEVLRAGPIVQASLNISCNHMVSEMSIPENILQRLGRLDRFGKNSEVNIFKVAITDDIIRGKSTGSSANFLALKLYGLRSATAWYNYLADTLSDKIFQLPELYQLYKKFHESNHRKSIVQDLESAIEKSITLLNKKVTEPVKVIKNNTEDKKPRISKNSLRGNNRFVQMAKLDVNDYTHPQFINEYAYQSPVSEQEEFDNLTESIAVIQGINSNGQRDSSKDLLSHMFKKHHNIIGKKKSFNDNALLNLARDPESPIYLSYTPEHLDTVGGETAKHSEAIYYAVCDKQPIGTISYKTILTLTNNQEKE